jgi:hypothetical protein
MEHYVWFMMQLMLFSLQLGIRCSIAEYYIFVFPYRGSVKAVERGDKTTRRVRVRVLALLENP